MSTQGFQQVQKQTQSLVLAPQLRQSLKILQVSALELRDAILEELQTNPTLEELPMDGVSIEEPTATNDKDSSGSDDGSSSGNDEDIGSNGSDSEFEINDPTLERLAEDWREYYAQENDNYSYTQDDAERRQHFFDSYTTETSLQEHLMQQAELSDTSPETLRAMEYIIGSLDDRGFFTSTVSDIALMTNLPLQKVQEALNLLKTLDPPGIGANDLQDCLLIQLRQNGKGKSTAATIVRDHFNLLLRRRIPEISRKIGLGIEDIHTAIEQISQLDPAPGRKFSEDNNRVIIPDVKVEKDQDEWIVTLNNDYIPRLQLSEVYKNLLKGKANAKERDYIQEKIRAGKYLINSIEQRQQTIERITRVLLDFQRDFFEKGTSKLRPLTMSQVAEEVGVHETTVSRAIANKYIDTPHGVFEFKYFFTPGYQSGDGESVSNKSVKERIAAIIDSENPAKPYSDQDIVKILAEEDVKIARRTVAKYRDELGILPTNLRRSYN